MSRPAQSLPGGTHAEQVPWLSFACLGGSMAVVGCYVGFSKMLVAAFPIFALAWMRFGIAAVAMAAWLRRTPDEPRLDRHSRWLIFLESFFGNFLFSICMLFGVARSSALAAGVVMAGIPAAVAVLSWLMLRERIPGRTLLGIACAVGGIALVSLTKNSGADASGTWIGNLLLFGALLCEASYVVIGKRLSGHISPKRISAMINLWGLVLVTPMGLWQVSHFDFRPVPASAWVLLVFYAIAASVVTVWLWMTGLKQVAASKAGVFTVMLPVAAAAVGVLFLGERFDASQAAAFGLALAGVLLATWPSKLR